VTGWLGDLFQLYHDWQLLEMTGTAFCQKCLGQPGSTTGFPLENLRQNAHRFNISMVLRNSLSTTLLDALPRLCKVVVTQLDSRLFLNTWFGGSEATAASLCMPYITLSSFQNTFMWAAWRSITQWVSPWGGAVPYPEKIPTTQLQDFCNGWAGVLASFASNW